MPRKSSGATYLPVLAALAYQYAADASQRGFIADFIFPVFETPFAAAEYPFIPTAAFLKLHAEKLKRAPRAAYARSDYEFDFNKYSCSEFGWEELIDDREAILYQGINDPQGVATMRCVDILLRNREKRVAAKALDTSVYGNDKAQAPWNSIEGCDPRADVKLQKKKVRDQSGMLPNFVQMSWTTFQDVLVCKAFTEATKYVNSVQTLPEEEQKRLVAAYFGVPEILIGNAVYDSAAKGQATVIADIWDPTKVLVGIKANSPKDLKEPCLGRSFLWTEDSPQMLMTETYREEGKRGNVIRVRHDLDEVSVFTNCARIITSTFK